MVICGDFVKMLLKEFRALMDQNTIFQEGKGSNSIGYPLNPLPYYILVTLADHMGLSPLGCVTDHERIYGFVHHIEHILEILEQTVDQMREFSISVPE